MDYNGHWDMGQKWKDLDKYPLAAQVYYSLVETGTHWYILYAFYHPRDWHPWPVPFFQHENDMEGCLMVVEKRKGYRYGYFQGMITASHDRYWPYTYGDRLKIRPGTRDERAVEALKRGITCTCLRGVYHPATYQDPYGHGLWAWDGGPFRGEYLEYQPKYLNVTNRLVSVISPFSDTIQGVRYYPGDTPRQPGPSHPAPYPASYPSPYRASIGKVDVPYRLVSIFEDGGLWQRRGDAETYARNGAFRGRFPPLAGANKANPPWHWTGRWRDNKPTVDLPAGAIANDPARLAHACFSGFSPDFDFSYVHNSYTDPNAGKESEGLCRTLQGAVRDSAHLHSGKERANSGPSDVFIDGDGELDFSRPQDIEAFRKPSNPPINIA